MIELGRAVATSSLPPQLFFDRWADPETWPTWDQDVDWVRMANAVALGAQGTLKPSAGPRLTFTVTTYEPGREFTDTGSLPGARLTFQHIAEKTDTGSDLLVRISLDGPLAWLFARLMGAQFRTAAQTSLDSLVATVERDHL